MKYKKSLVYSLFKRVFDFIFTISCGYMASEVLEFAMQEDLQNLKRYCLIFGGTIGKVGVGICYDVYNFPEIIAYAAAKGARLFLNPTAIGWGVSSGKVFRTKTESDSLRSNIYVASANLVGKDLYYEFTGCSHIMGPVGKHGDVEYYAGHPFGDPAGETPGMFLGTIDLALVDYQSINTFKNLYHTNPVTKTTDWRPDLYARIFGELAESEEWKSRTIE